MNNVVHTCIRNECKALRQFDPYLVHCTINTLTTKTYFTNRKKKKEKKITPTVVRLKFSH